MNRDELEKKILAIPVWRRFIICTILERKKWKLARAYSAVVADLLCGRLGYKDRDRNDAILEKVWSTADQLWMEIYGIAEDDPTDPDARVQ